MRPLMTIATCLLAIAALQAADFDITGTWMATGPCMASSPAGATVAAELMPDPPAPGDLEFAIDKDTITATGIDPDQPAAPPEITKESYTVVSRSADGMVILVTDPDNKSDTKRGTVTRKGTGFTLDDGNFVLTFIPLDPAAVAAVRKKRLAASATAAKSTP